MSNFFWDETTLSYPKANLNPLPGGADSTKYVQATEWNTLCQAVVDSRTTYDSTKIIDVTRYATGGSGTSGDPWTGWVTSVNALPDYSQIFFPEGIWYHTSALDMGTKTGWHIFGAPGGGTKIRSHFNGSAIKALWGDHLVNLSLSGPASVRTVIEDIYVENLTNDNSAWNPSNTGHALELFGGTYIIIKNVVTGGFKFACSLDACELVQIQKCDFEGFLSAGIWLLNSNELHAASEPQLTNAITVQDTQINMSSTTEIGIVDDGGYSHSFIGVNNFNGGAFAGIFAGVNRLTMEGSHCESQADTVFAFTTATHYGGGGTGACSFVDFRNMVISAASNKFAFNFTANTGPVELHNIQATGSTVDGYSVAGQYNITSLVHSGCKNSATGNFFATDAAGGTCLFTFGQSSNTNGFHGFNTLDPKTSIDVNGSIAVRFTDLPLTDGAQNDNVDTTIDDAVPLGITRDKGAFRMTQGSATSISGFTDGANGRLLRLAVRDGSSDITLKHETTSTAANRIKIPGGMDLPIRAGEGVTLYYDTNASRWRPIVTAAQVYIAAAPQDLSGAGAALVTAPTTFFATTGAGNAVTLANGLFAGQEKILKGDSGYDGTKTTVVTPATPSGFSTLTYNNIGDSVALEWSGTAWRVKWSIGAVVTA